MLETVYHFDKEEDKVISQKMPLGPKGEMVPFARYEYHPDHNGERTTITYPSEKEAHFSYHAGYLSSISYEDQVYEYTERDLSGSRTGVSTTKGVLGFQYDSCGRFQSILSPTYSAWHFAYDACGNVSSYVYHDNLGLVDCEYAYDDLDQLISENGQTYAYDSLNNRVQKNAFRHTLNTLSQVTSDGEIEYEYDANGNLIKADEVLFTYDSLDRLISVEKEGKQYSYVYDPFNRRLGKSDGWYSTKYYWDEKNEIGSSNRELRVLGEGHGAEIGAAVFISLRGWTYIPVHDHRGNVISLLGYDKEVYRYTAFGEELTNRNHSPWRFCSKRVDPETGYSYFGRRYYSPYLGRWVSPDPKGFEDGPNLYSYVHNRPLFAFDLYGLETEEGHRRSAWSTAREFGMGAALHLWDGVCGAWDLCGTMGEWMIADSFYEMGDRSLFDAKSTASYENWKTLGSVAYNQPISTTGDLFAPGIMAVIRSPTSPEAWGRASVDVAFFGIAAMKFAKAGAVTRAGRLGGEVSTLGKAGNGSIVKHISPLPKSNPLIDGKFTKSNFRRNLIEITGINPGKSAQAHHIFPQKYQKNFKEIGLNIHDPKNGCWWETSNHLKSARSYNDKWWKFLRERPSYQETIQFGREIIKDYGIIVE